MYKVLKDFKGSPDGVRVIEFSKGQEVELEESLARVALDEKWVEPVKPKAEKRTKSASLADELAAALDNLPAAIAAREYENADYVVGQMRNYFGELFTADVEAQIRGLFPAV